MRGVTPGWLTYRKPRKWDGVAIKPNAYRWVGYQCFQFFRELRWVKELADGRHSMKSAEIGSHVARLFAERQQVGICGCDSGVPQCALWGRLERCDAPESSLKSLALTRRRAKFMWVDVRGCELKAESRRGVVLVNLMTDLLFNAVMVGVLEVILKSSEELSGREHQGRAPSG